MSKKGIEIVYCLILIREDVNTWEQVYYHYILCQNRMRKKLYEEEQKQVPANFCVLYNTVKSFNFPILWDD